MRPSFKRRLLRTVTEVVGVVSHLLSSSFAAANITLSNNGATATFATGAVAITQARSENPALGKTYVEFTITNRGGGDIGVGVGQSNLPITSTNDNYVSAGYYSYDPLIYVGNSAVVATFGSTFITGMVLCLAYDADAKTIQFRQDGGSWSSLYSTASLTGPLYPFVYQDGGSGNVITLNTGQSPFLYTPPSGFIGPDA